MRRALLWLSLGLCLWPPAALSQEAPADGDPDTDTDTDTEGSGGRPTAAAEGGRFSSVRPAPGCVTTGISVRAEAGVSVEVVEENWTIVLQPRCCSDCTFVSRGFKCKVKSCLSNCPWARSAATPSAVPLF